MQKGYKRTAKGMAILRCFIGLFIVVIVVLLATFLISLDYSDKLDPEASLRPYVAQTPEPSEAAALEGTVIPADSTPEATEAPTPTPSPSPTPTPTPSPTPTPEPTPVPTQIPESSFSEMSTDQSILKYVPTETTNDQILYGITESYRSEENGNQVLVIRGYAYLDDSSFDGSALQTYLIINRDSVDLRAIVKANHIIGISGVDHADAQCANAANSDFEFVLNSASLPDDIYTMGLVLQYTVNGETKLDYVALPTAQSFTVLNTLFLGSVTVTE